MLLLSLLACVRTPRDLPESFDLPDDLSEYGDWLAAAESRYSDIVPGAERTIRWADPDRPAKAPIALVYFHGYSATRQEVSPLCEQVGDALGANTYFTRLAGHGRSDDAMAEAELADWLTEAEEALAIGQALGDKVVIVGTSTGATLATWLAARHPGEIDATVYVSPNFGPQAKGSRMLLMPGRRLIAKLLIGEYREWEPANEGQARYWTWRYPTVALFPMMELVRLVEKTDLRESRQPTLVIYSPNDQVIRPDLVEERMAEMGGQPVDSVIFEHAGTPSNHVLAGDIISPNNTDPMTEIINEFLVRTLGVVPVSEQP